MNNLVNYEILSVDEIISLDNKDISIPLYEKVIKLGEEIGEMSTAKEYLTIKEYIEESYDAFNIAIAVYNTLKKKKINIDYLKSGINKALPDNKLENAIPIFYGKICSSMLLKLDSNSKSRNSNNTDLESYLFELILLLSSQLKFIMNDDIDLSIIVYEKLEKWKIKQNEYIEE